MSFGLLHFYAAHLVTLHEAVPVGTQPFGIYLCNVVRKTPLRAQPL